MNVEKLKEFRAKLECAKFLCGARKFDDWIAAKFIDAGLMGFCANAGNKKIMPNDVFKWYVNSCRTPDERRAMWDNSIAAVDAQIAKGKK